MILEQKEAYPYEYMNSFERFFKEMLPDKKRFYRSVKDGTTNDNGETLNGNITDQEYLARIFSMQNMEWT